MLVYKTLYRVLVYVEPHVSDNTLTLLYWMAQDIIGYFCMCVCMCACAFMYCVCVCAYVRARIYVLCVCVGGGIKCVCTYITYVTDIIMSAFKLL